MFPVYRKKYMLRKQIVRLGSKEMFLNRVKNIFASHTQIKVAYYSFLGIKQKLTRAYACCHVSASARAEITRALKENPNKHGDCKKIFSSWLAL